VKDKLQGKGEELKGKVTGDRVEEGKGKARQGVGDVKNAAREARDKIEGRDDPA
jgi:uncharacterized protein YjbJ (UPF0337 family)